MATRRELLTGSTFVPWAGLFLGRGAAVKAKVDSGSVRGKIQKRFLPNVVLRTHQDEEVHFYDDLVRDKIVMINMFYARCEGICPPITANLVKVQKLLGDRVGRDIFMYSITLKPEQDKTADLRNYMEMHRVRPGWTYLTGSPDDIELLRRRLGFTDPNPEVDKDTSNHIGNVRVGNEPLALWAACQGLAPAEWIVEAMSWLDRSKPQRPPRG